MKNVFTAKGKQKYKVSLQKCIAVCVCVRACVRACVRVSNKFNYSLLNAHLMPDFAIL